MIDLSDSPLTGAELDRLDDFLVSNRKEGMNLESVDGYFTALICGPEMVLPSEYLPQVLGEAYSFANDEQASDTVGLLMRHWNAIASTLLRTLQEPGVYMPLLLEAEDGRAPANDWAQGFMRGIAARPGGWRAFVENDEYNGPAFPILWFANEKHPDPTLRPGTVSAEKREELLQLMIAAVPVIYRHFESARRSGAGGSPGEAPGPRRRSAPKVGRNAPCPCGSGRKFKHCCASNASSVH